MLTSQVLFKCCRSKQRKCRSEIVCVCVYNTFQSETVCFYWRQSMFVTESLFLSYIVCVCQRQSLSVTESLCMWQTVCVCHSSWLFMDEWLSMNNFLQDLSVIFKIVFDRGAQDTHFGHTWGWGLAKGRILKGNEVIMGKICYQLGYLV